MDADFLRDNDTPANAEFIAYLDEKDLQELITDEFIYEDRNGDRVEVCFHKDEKNDVAPYDDVMDALHASYKLIQYLKYTQNDFDDEISRVNPTEKIEKTYEYYSEIQSQYE